jgi:hypothetical protein
MKQNAPGPRAEGVVCLLAGNTDAHSTDRVRVQYLAQPGIPHIRAGLLAPLAFGEAA